MFPSLVRKKSTGNLAHTNKLRAKQKQYCEIHENISIYN